LLPSRTKDRTERAEPIEIKSSTESVEPSFAIPYTEKVLPIRIQDRRLIDEPIVAKSRTLKLLPRRDIPYTL
jgi:hypothetical protein